MSVDGAAPASDGTVVAAGDDVYVVRHGRQTRVRLRDFSTPAAAAGSGDGVVKAPMHGRVLEILVAVGDRVTAGQRLAVIEAMKMEHTLRAPFAGTVMQIAVGAGAQVVEGARDYADRGAADGIKWKNGPASHQALCRLQLGSATRRLDQGKAQAEAQKRRKTRAYSPHPHGAQARRGTHRRRFALLGDPRRGDVPAAHPRHQAVRRQGRDRTVRIVLEPKSVLVVPRPYRAFQGWRYLAAKDAPRDLEKAAQGAAAMPESCGGSCANSA